MLINVSDARRMLADLLKRVARGDDIVIAKRGRPVARLVPVEDRRAVPAVPVWPKGG
jgi:prevent-host-death family protein